jgi:hypothetical protein
MIVPPHELQAERDLAGAAVSSILGAELVREVVNVTDLYDQRVARITKEALAIPAEPDVDLSGLDGGILIGPHVIARGMAITGNALNRVIAIANITHESPVRVAELVADLPSRPSPTLVKEWAARVEGAAKRRALLIALADAQMKLTEGAAFSEAIISVRELVSSS